MQKIKNWWSWDTKSVLEKLKTTENGLSEKDYLNRIDDFGKNLLKEESGNPWWKKLLNQLNDYLIWILIAGATISIFAGEILDGVLIILIIGFMAILGYIQDAKAEKAIEALKKLEVEECLILRGGRQIKVMAENLVPGEIVLLKVGDMIPADLRVIESSNAYSDESSLTGESIPVSKNSDELNEKTPLAERRNMLYKGTILTSGKTKAVVVETGMETELGKIADILQKTETEKTPLEVQLEQLGKMLGTISLFLVGVVLTLNVFLRGEDLLHATVEAVALAVAAVPEGLPAVMTMSLAFGVQKMAKHNALVRKLRAVEALGSVSVVCTDKTGTITEGKMRVQSVIAEVGSPDVERLKDGHPIYKRMQIIGANCNNKSDPTELAIYDWVDDLESHELETITYKKLKEFEFTSSLKKMTTIHQLPSGHSIAFTKGAPEMVLELCSHIYSTNNDGKAEKVEISDKNRESIDSDLERLANEGLRVLAFAERNLTNLTKDQKRENVEKNLIFVGLIALSDPPKKEVLESITLAKMAGIRPVMITGDNPITARAIAQNVGIVDENGEKALTGQELDELFEMGKIDRILSTQIFARVSPKHKSMLVDVFQKAGKHVSMLGDGVNDAPSIKKANVGVSMGSGSDVTKSTSDLILLDNNYKTLVYAVEEGRNILNRIRLFVGYLLSCNLAEIGIFLVATFMGVPVPLTAVMLLLLNVVTDAAPAIAMAKEPSTSEVMESPPRDPDEPIITKKMWANIAWVTLVATVAVMVSYFVGKTESIKTAQTMAFVTISFLELFRAFTARSVEKSVFQIGVFKNIWINLSVLLGTVVTLAVVYLGSSIFNTEPLSINLLSIATLIALSGPILEEMFKPVVRKIS